MKISLISITLACAVITSCQYRPKNFYANQDQNIPKNGIGPSGNNVPTDYVAPSNPTNDNINYVHRQGTTVGNWEPTSGNFVLNNGNTFEVGTDGAKVNIKAELNNLEIIELRLTNIYGGRDYHVDVNRILNRGHNVKVDKGTYRIDVRNRWETHIDPRPTGRLTVTW